MKETFEILNINNENGLYILNEHNWKGILPERVEKVLEDKIKPDAFFLLGNEPIILFFNNPNNENLIFKHCWNFNHSPIIFIIKEKEINIYNGFSFIKDWNKSENIPNENWKTDFSYYNIVSGKVFEKFNKDIFNKKSVDERLLENIKAVRNVLIENLSLKKEITNSLIGRVIFIRYLIDRKVIISINGEQNGLLTNEKLCNILQSKDKTYKLFNDIKVKFNGNLFPITNQELFSVNESHLELINRMLKGEDISTGQVSFFDIYDFSIIPIELVSHIYEFFIGENEQEKSGAYYTPLFLVNNILHETVSKYFELHPNEYNCKVLDPACGSGIFLVETLRKIIKQYQKNTPNFNKDLNKYKLALNTLLTDNIFGIDIDENALNVAIFSLYITLLDYLEPPDIANYQFPPLLNKNFFENDFFELEAEYNKILNDYNFEFIIGNPPWGKVEKSVELYEKYWKEREKKERKEIKVSDKEIAQVFLIRVSDFKFKECAFIITSKVFYNVKAVKFRKYLLENFKIRKVFELSSVRHEIFSKSNDPSTCPASIIYYSYSPDIEDNKKNVVTHVSLKPNKIFEYIKIFIIEKFDQKQLFQNYFMEFDWVWKVLVYGNIIDFYFIKRLNKIDSIQKLIDEKHELTVGQGLKYTDGNKKFDSSSLIGKRFIDTKQKDLKHFYIRSNLKNWTKESVGYLPKNTEIFDSPSVLIKESTDNKFYSISALIYQDSVFTSSITAIKSKHNNISELKNLCGLFNSTLLTYFFISNSSSIGIEREQSHDEEKLNFPYRSSEKLVSLVTQIEQKAKQKYEAKENSMSDKFDEFEIEYNQLLSEIDEEIFKLYQISEQERTLIDYAINISIPLIKKKFDKVFYALDFEKEKDKNYLKEYAQIFISHFNNILKFDGSFFEIEVFYTDYIICLYFKVIAIPSSIPNQIIWNKKDSDKEILDKLLRISITKNSQDLFIQKDIKGFEEDAFYVIKPNEYKNWHKAIAYLDLSEFINEIMESAREEFNQ